MRKKVKWRGMGEFVGGGVRLGWSAVKRFGKDVNEGVSEKKK